MDDTTNYLRIASQRDYHTHCTVLERNVLKYTLRKIQRDPTLLRGP